MAIGDAYAGGFEYCTPDFVACHHRLCRYRQHPRDHGKRPGSYTDDTQMTLATAEQLLSPQEWSAHNIAEMFVGVFHRDYRDGYSTRCRSVLEANGSGADLLASLAPARQQRGGHPGHPGRTHGAC